MTQRVAGLWRAQGESFLTRHHATVLDDVARLRGAVIVGEADAMHTGEPGWHEKLDAALSKLRGWDEAVLDRLREMHADEEADRADRAAHAEAKGAARAARQERAERPRPLRARPVIDLTEPEPRVAIPVIGASTCGRCKQVTDEDRLVRPFGERKPPLCIPCAREVAGLRSRSRY
jgi:hypothetical protein